MVKYSHCAVVKSSPLKSFHFPTASIVAGALTGGFGLIASVWVNTDLKIDDLKATEFRRVESENSRYKEMEAEMASQKGRAKHLEALAQSATQKLNEYLEKNFEEKYKAELIRSESLRRQLDERDQQLAVQNSVGANIPQILDLQKRLEIVSKERDDLKKLHTDSRPSTIISPLPARRAIPVRDEEPVRAIPVDLSSASEKLIKQVRSNKNVTASQLIDELGSVPSDERYAILCSVSDFVERPISPIQMSTLVQGLSEAQALLVRSWLRK